MTTIDNISPGDVVTVDRKDIPTPYVVLKTGKAKDFNESIKQRSGLKTISQCPTDQAQVTLGGQVNALSAHDLLVRLVPVAELNKHVPVWWQLAPRFYRPLVSQFQMSSRFVHVSEVQLVGREGLFCCNCGDSEIRAKSVVRISLLRQNQCTRCQVSQEEFVVAKEQLNLSAGDVEAILEEINNGEQ